MSIALYLLAVTIEANNINVTNLQITNGHTYNVWFGDTAYSSISNCIIHSSRWNGTCISQLSNKCKVSNCDFYYNKIGIVTYGTNALILDSNIFSNGNGIYIDTSQINSNNSIINCNVFLNGYGMYVFEGSNNKGVTVFHNNFINHDYNGYDQVINSYYNTTLKEGNYWSDYTGIDLDGNGIGDTPYSIPMGSNQDFYPFMKQNGWLTSNLPPVFGTPNPIYGSASNSLNLLWSIPINDRYGHPVIVSTHPRTRKRLDALGVPSHQLVQHAKPFGFHDYNHLQMHAFCAISDSGTIAEECSILGFPAITPRDAIQRPEGIDAGCLILTGLDRDTILNAIEGRPLPVTEG